MFQFIKIKARLDGYLQKKKKERKKRVRGSTRRVDLGNINPRIPTTPVYPFAVSVPWYQKYIDKNADAMEEIEMYDNDPEGWDVAELDDTGNEADDERDDSSSRGGSER